jgi:hypothetical protein
MNETFDSEFKQYMFNKGINFDPNIFDLKFNPPQNFASYRQAEMDTARVGTFGTLVAVPFMSKRFAMKRFLGMTAEEISENEQMWKEENGLSENKLPALSELRSAGITSGNMESDIQDLSQSQPPPEGMEGGLDMDTSGAPAPSAAQGGPASGANPAPPM